MRLGIGLVFLSFGVTLWAADTNPLEKVLPDFPKSLATPWDKATAQPSWFPKVACRDAWKGKKDLYRFDFTRYARANYTDDKAEALGCKKDTPEATRECLLTKAYEQYEAALLKETKVARRQCYKKWTILVAMDASNNLHPYSLWDLYEMEAKFEGDRAASTLRKDVIVQHDGDDTLGVHRLHMFQTDQDFKQKALADFRGKQSVRDRESPIVEIKPEGFLSSKAKRFVDFVDWGMKRYPAEHYLVVLWGHGQGWLVQHDKDSALHLSGQELADSLQQIYLKTLEGKRPIDNFVADACFMQGVELATTLSPYARFISGSAQVQDFMGLPYRTFFYEMNSSYPRITRRLKRDLEEAKEQKLPERVRRLETALERIKGTDTTAADEPLAVAYMLPDLMAASLDEKGLQGRVDTGAEAYKKGIDFFTYASVDSTALRQKLVPALDALATRIVTFVKAAKDKKSLQDRKDYFYFNVPKLQLFESKLQTRELGSANGFLKEDIAKKFPVDEARRIARQAHAGLDDKPGVLRALEEAVPAFRFAERYEKFPHFRSMGFWLPYTSAEYQAEIAMFEKSLFFRFNPGTEKSSAWREMFRLIYEE